MAGGKTADRGRVLCVEQDEQPGDTVLGLEGAVVKKPARLLPAGLGVDHASRPGPADGREVHAGQFLLAGPADEVSRVGAVAGLRAGQPCLQVALPGCCQGEVVSGEPVKQGDGGLDDPLSGHDLAVGGTSAAEPAAEPPDHVPDGVAVQQLLLAGVGAFADDTGDPVIQPGHLLIARRQRPYRDQDAAQVLDGLAGRQFVEDPVRELPGRIEAVQDGRGCALIKPGGHGAWPTRRVQGVIEGLQLRADLPVLVAEQVTQPLLHCAAAAPAGMDAPGLPAARAAAPEAGITAGASRAERLARGAAADPPGLTAASAPGPALLAGPAPGLAGGFGDHAGGVLPADSPCSTSPSVT